MQKKDAVTVRELPKVCDSHTCTLYTITSYQASSIVLQTFSDVKEEDLPRLYETYKEPEVIVNMPSEWIREDEKILDESWKLALRKGREFQVAEKFSYVFQFVSEESKFHLVDRFETESGIQIEEGPR